MTLDMMKIGDKKKIKNIDETLPIKKRLLEIGFNHNEIIECILINPFNNSMAYEIKDTLIAIRKKDGKKIFIGDLDE